MIFQAPLTSSIQQFKANLARLRALLVLLALVSLAAAPRSARADDLKVMPTGLGSGTITSSPPAINCGATCDATFAISATVTLTATAAPNSVFDGWDTDQDAYTLTPGDCAGITPVCTIAMNVPRSVRPRFRPATLVPSLVTTADLLTEGFPPAHIQQYLTDNPDVDTAAEFVAALPAVFRENWIVMTRSESLQTGTSEYPRIIVFNERATAVFTFALSRHASFPGADPGKIEYMQWDKNDKNFRMHEITVDPALLPAPGDPKVSEDDVKCSRCHSTQNVINRGSTPGTDGLTPGTVKVKNKPNWDSYDSWGAMLPFNRDRIYQGSAEAAAFRKLLNPWTWRSKPQARAFIEQLKLQPAGTVSPRGIWRMRGGNRDGVIKYEFDTIDMTMGQREPAPVFGGVSLSSNYNFDGQAGSDPSPTINQGGSSITLQAATLDAMGTSQLNSDEGRGVQLFDLLGGLDGQLNAVRIADELINHRFATGSVPIDVRPIALAVLDRCISLNVSGTGLDSSAPMTFPLSFFDARNGMNIGDLVRDTAGRVKDFPRRKADFQQFNLENSFPGDLDAYVMRDSALAPVDPHTGLLQNYLATINNPGSVGMDRVREEIFRRPVGDGGGIPDRSIIGGKYTDRETYDSNHETLAVARYFLEPLGVSVDKWSLNVRGRSRGYNFADVLGDQIDVIVGELKTSLGIGLNTSNITHCPSTIGLVNAAFGAGRLPGAADLPTYTDVQRIFNRGCIECHGGLRYPPYENFGTSLDLSEDENPPGSDRRMTRSYNAARSRSIGLTGSLYRRITHVNETCDMDGVGGLMPFCGPRLSKTDIETIRRWIVGGNPYSEGEPHILTVDGVNYDFQAAGEFVLLRDEGMELQARHVPVSSIGPVGPDGHTGLTSCASVNSAVAMRMGRDRITYQPNISGEPDPSGLQLRINGEMLKLGFEEFVLPSGGRIIPSSGSGGLSFQSQGGTTVTITPWWWDSQRVWVLNINVRQGRGTEGLMGAIAPGNWLPALPDGSLLGPMPSDLDDRYVALYEKFGDAWRVDEKTTLFEYPPHLKPGDFVDKKWPFGEAPKRCDAPQLAGGLPPMPPAKPIDFKEAAALCDGIGEKARLKNCILDVSAMGDPGFGNAYRDSEKLVGQREQKIEPPALAFPSDNERSLSGPVDFAWEDKLPTGDETLRYRHCLWPEEQEFGFQFCGKTGMRANKLNIPELDKGKTYMWKIIVEGENGVTSESETRRFTSK